MNINPRVRIAAGILIVLVVAGVAYLLSETLAIETSIDRLQGIFE